MSHLELKWPRRWRRCDLINRTADAAATDSIRAKCLCWSKHFCCPTSSWAKIRLLMLVRRVCAGHFLISSPAAGFIGLRWIWASLPASAANLPSHHIIKWKMRPNGKSRNRMIRSAHARRPILIGNHQTERVSYRGASTRLLAAAARGLPSLSRGRWRHRLIPARPRWSASFLIALH